MEREMVMLTGDSPIDISHPCIQQISSPRVLIVVNAEWYFLSHRLSLAKALRAKGCNVVVAASVERNSQGDIEAHGFRFVPLHLQRRSTELWREVACLWELYRLYRLERPDLVHNIAIKPVIYGSIAAKIANVPAVINTIPGLGYVFLQKGWRSDLLRLIVLAAYRIALWGKKVYAIFQNPDDRKFFISERLITSDRAVLIRGSGVDTFQFAPSPELPGKPVVLLASRLLWDKGVGELVEAGCQLNGAGVSCRVVLVGTPDPENPKSIPLETIKAWQSEGIIEWWGLRNDMPEVLKMASIVVLPSYREGVPKVLLEAAATGRPIVATDVPGCREVVRHGDNGLLVPARDPSALADAIKTLLENKPLRTRMGIRSREIAVSEFSEERVIEETLNVYRGLLGSKWPESINTNPSSCT